MPAKITNCRAVLFDLDGTLADTAPELVAATNAVLHHLNRDGLPENQLRRHAGDGASAMIHFATGIGTDDAVHSALRQIFLEYYRTHIGFQTRLFDGIRSLLDKLAVPWGIVTNKPEYLTKLMLPHIPLEDATVVICGDTLPEAKPSPLPILEACRRLNLAPQSCVYIGDSARDIQAAHAAGMKAVGAAWGYCEKNELVAADTIVDSVEGLTAWLADTGCLKG